MVLMMFQEVVKLKDDGCAEELHVVEWFTPGGRENKDTYRRLDTFLESSLQQAGPVLTGVVQVCLLLLMISINVETCHGRFGSACFMMSAVCNALLLVPHRRYSSVSILQ